MSGSDAIVTAPSATSVSEEALAPTDRRSGVPPERVEVMLAALEDASSDPGERDMLRAARAALARSHEGPDAPPELAEVILWDVLARVGGPARPDAAVGSGRASAGGGEVEPSPVGVASGSTSGPRTATVWSAAPSSARPAGRRRWGLVLRGVAVGAAVAVPSYLAWFNLDVGQQWQARSVAAEADVASLETENDQLETDLSDLRQVLYSSERDVGRLEERVAELASEKAEVEDERETANAVAERITEVAIAYDEVAEWFQLCRAEQVLLTDMVFDFETYYDWGQTYLISDQIDNAAYACDTAEWRLASLRDYVDALGG